jgi:hypothetical protein
MKRAPELGYYMNAYLLYSTTEAKQRQTIERLTQYAGELLELLTLRGIITLIQQ